MFKSTQDKFIYSQVIMMTLAATLQRNPVYSHNATDEGRRSVRNEISSILDTLSNQYLNRVTEKKHKENIVFLANLVSKKHSNSLLDKKFRIGTAQKAINLFLKYLWCLGKINEPPHFPIDAIMLKKIPGCSNIRWTQLDSMDVYEQIVEKAKEVAGTHTLATWELSEYSG